MSWILVCLLFIVILAAAGGFYCCNRLARHFIRARRKVFSAKSKVRNVDYLAIGELPDDATLRSLTGDAKGVSVYTPGASLTSCYEILRHTHSILNGDNSVVILAYNRAATGYTIFDIPLLHRVSIRRLGLEKTQKHYRYPLLFHPVLCARFLLRIHRRGGSVAECEDSDMLAFCAERNIRLVLYEV